ncbi:DUF5672 family protein [Desulfosarcina variabilis]|uniref:DUF5672 family protein n=1 Tax=Desulfosarcina variabilis TaxID=2300 RepID=UPI003AFAFC33
MSETFRGSFLQFDITPNVSVSNPAFLFGIGDERRASKSVAIPLSLEMCMLEDSDYTRLLFISADIFGFEKSVVEKVVRYAAQWGVAPEGVVINASHTFYAPGTIANMPESMGPYYENYSSQILQIILSNLQNLYDRLEPCTIRHGKVEAEVGVNQRYLKNGRFAGEAHHESKFIQDTPIVRIDLGSTKNRILWINHGCYPMGMGANDDRISADYPGFIKYSLKRYGVAHCVMFFQGAGADIVEAVKTNDRWDVCDSLEKVRQYGQKLADTIKNGTQKKLSPVRGRFCKGVEPFTLSVDEKINDTIKEKLSYRFNGHQISGKLNVQFIRIGEDFNVINIPSGITSALADKIHNIGSISKSDFLLGYVDGIESYIAADNLIERERAGDSRQFQQDLKNYRISIEKKICVAVNDILSKIKSKNSNDNHPLYDRSSKSVVRKKRILFLELLHQSTGGFLDHIVKSLKEKYDVKYLKTSSMDEVRSAVTWADIVWLEWANQMAIHVTNNISEIQDKKVVCRLHGYEVYTDMPARINWNRVHRLIFVAHHKKEIFNQKFPNKNVPQLVIRNGIQLENFSISENKLNTKRLVLLGYLNFRKGLPILLHFFQQLLKHDPDYFLYIRGEFQDPRLEMAVKTMINELNLIDKIEFTGWIKDINHWFADKSHILSFSLEESFHYALGEGMAAGLKPVIHAWTESRDIWPNHYIFSTLDDFLNIIQDTSYEPEKYRTFIFENNLDANSQVKNIDLMFNALMRENFNAKITKSDAKKINEIETVNPRQKKCTKDDQNTKSTAKVISKDLSNRGILKNKITSAHLMQIYRSLKKTIKSANFNSMDGLIKSSRRLDKDISSPIWGVIVETRCHPDLEYVIIDFHTKNDIPIQLFHGKSNVDFIMSTAVGDLVRRGNVVLTQLETDILTGDMYNALFLSKMFWNNIVGREKILIFQPDTICCSQSEYTIKDFINYDYIGSKWSRNRPVGMIIDGGNGGLSLRDWRLSYECLSRFSPRYWPGGEDGYFAFHIELIGGNVGKNDECAKFSTQEEFIFNSWGGHNISCLKKNDLNRFLLYCPEAAFMTDRKVNNKK